VLIRSVQAKTRQHYLSTTLPSPRKDYLLKYVRDCNK